MFICASSNNNSTFTLTSAVWSATARGASSSLGFGSFSPTNPVYGSTYVKDLYEIKDTAPGEEAHYFQLTFNAQPAANPWNVTVIIDGIIYSFTGGSGVASTYDLPLGDDYILTVGDHIVEIF